MAGRVLRGGCAPKHLRATGKGWREDNASGFVRYADDVVDDVRQGPVSKDFADITPGFGTYHPQDIKVIDVLDDPSPIRNARPLTEPMSKADLNISDQEIALSIREGRAPRPGF